MKSKVLHLISGIFIGALICVSLYSIPQATGADWERSLPFTPQQLGIIRQVKLTLSAYQVDGDKKGKIDDTKMYYGALRGLVASIDDPYTRFLDPEALAEETLDVEGEYGGLGIYMANRDGRTTVIAPIEDTPAARAGIKPLDEILKVDDEVVAGMESNEVVKKLRGEPGTKVTLHIRRKDESELIPITIERETIKIKTIRMEMLDDGAAYIKLNHFNMKTDEDLRAALETAKSQNAKGVIMDLRNNPGGLLDVCVDVTSRFISEGVVVGMKGRFERANDTLYAKPGLGLATELPLVVLVNEGSASASEIFAGAIKDHKRGTIVGSKTFGKGSVQTLFNLPDGSGIFITIARYHTPSGFEIDQVGLEPDITVEGEPKKERKEDEQFQKALSVLNEQIKEKK